ncbi:MAG: hypothetical protein KC464_09785, partial [Myxococcales bacterium]|nr:hypothetical protein [Myxococcales bacterium]
MTDLVLTLGWLGGLACGLGGAIVLHRLGLASTYVRDLLHVGAGVWILGWAWWTTPAWPIAITAVVTAGTALVPTAASRWHLAARLHRSVTGGDERWSGLVLYTLAYAALTPVGLCDRPLPAAAGLLALSLGDGVGGAVGRRFGRHHYRAPGGKVKSLEGSA